MTIRDGVIPPTINYDHPDPTIDLDVVPNVKRSADVGAVLSNSFGFGGQNACLVMARRTGLSAPSGTSRLSQPFG